MTRILIVGAGFAGAVHARELADAGFEVDVIDKRNHIGGNCFDYVHESGVRIHRYGPHLFHTSSQKVVDWLTRFTEWIPYEHRVVARLSDKRLVPLPVNLDTINEVFGTRFETADAVTAFLATKSVARSEITSAEEYLYSAIGTELTDLFFRPYTSKMWGMSLSEIDAAVVRRLQIRTSRDDRYFLDDSFQAMPKDGFTTLFERMLNHPRIHVRLSEAFDKERSEQYDFCFNSMPIDEYYSFTFGELPYRSIKFHLIEVPITQAQSRVVINYTDASPYTRETWWHVLPGHHIYCTNNVVQTIEEPCDYRLNNFERYYPVKSKDGRFDLVYRRYAEQRSHGGHMNFIGRCGTYQYLDMHQVINQSLMNVQNWLRDRASFQAS